MSELDPSNVHSSSAASGTATADPARLLPRPERALGALDDLRQRIRRLFLWDGVVRFGLALASVFVVSFILDYFLHLPRVVRVVLLVAMVLYLVSVIIRRIIRPRHLPLALDDLAVLVEDQTVPGDGGSAQSVEEQERPLSVAPAHRRARA